MIDGDLCEQYNSLDHAKKRAIAENLDRTPNEVYVHINTVMCVLIPDREFWVYAVVFEAFYCLCKCTVIAIPVSGFKEA